MSTTSGPTVPVASTLITVTDPTVNSACDRVQIQNGSNFSLAVTAGPLGTIEVPACWNITVPSYGGQPILILPAAFGNPGNGITFLWCYPGDPNPVDGPASAYVTNTPLLRVLVPKTTFTTTGASVESQQVVTLNQADRSILFFATSPSVPLQTRVSVVGNNSNFDWAALANAGNPFFYSPGLVSGVILFIPVYGEIDTNVTITLGQSTVIGVSETWWALVGPDDRTLYTAAERFQVTSNPGYQSASVPVSLTLAASGSGTLVPAPPAGQWYQIDMITLNYAAAVTTCSIAGTLSAISYGLLNVSTVADGSAPLILPFRVPALSEGLRVTAGAAAGFTIATVYTPILS